MKGMNMEGVDIRLSKLFDGGRNATVVAVDHGMFDGPYDGMIDIPATLERLGDAADAILLSPGSMRRCGDYFGRRGAPLAIVRINFNTVFSFKWKYHESICTELYSAADAQALGADLVLICLTLKTGQEAVDARNVELWTKLCIEAHANGLPVIGEYFPNHDQEKSPEEFHEEIMIGCRMLQELGADCIKTFYTHAFSELTAKVGIPILGLGAEKTPTDRDALDLAWREIRDGARGVVFGRNVIQAPDPPKFLQALNAVVKDGCESGEALLQAGL